MTDLQQLLHKAAAFSRATFGKGERTDGVLDHMAKEALEIKKEDTCYGRAGEWVDMVILAQDGLMRALQEHLPDAPLSVTSQTAVSMIVGKYNKNELREWPDWRTADPTKAIEHVRGTHD